MIQYLELRCDEIGLPTTGYPTRFYNANRFLHLFDLCFQVGCRCGFDDRVHCAVDRAEDIHLWAAFHLKCETDQWCQCHDPKLERKPVSEITVQSDRKETPGSPSVGNWCSPPSPNARTPSGLTCSADQYCIPWSDIELSVQYGVEMAISPGICFLKDIAASIPAKRDLNLELGTSPNTSVSAALRKRQGLPASAPATVEKRALVSTI